MTYKTIGHTPMGIEVQKNEYGHHRFCRGANIIGDEAGGRYMVSDVTIQIVNWHDCETVFSYTLLCEGD
jgi:hypothetical protein